MKERAEVVALKAQLNKFKFILMLTKRENWNEVLEEAAAIEQSWGILARYVI